VCHQVSANKARKERREQRLAALAAANANATGGGDSNGGGVASGPAGGGGQRGGFRRTVSRDSCTDSVGLEESGDDRDSPTTVPSGRNSPTSEF